MKALLNNNAVTKEHFRAISGYDTLQKQLAKTLAMDPLNELLPKPMLVLLFQMVGLALQITNEYKYQLIFDKE